jgi:hypothetical protein
MMRHDFRDVSTLPLLTEDQGGTGVKCDISTLELLNSALKISRMQKSIARQTYSVVSKSGERGRMYKSTPLPDV